MKIPKCRKHFLLQLKTGSRPGELVKLAPEFFDCTKDVWLVRLPEHKTAYIGKDRIIYFGLKSQAVVKPYLSRDPAQRLFRPCDSEAQRRAAITRETPQTRVTA